jgi:hypothetical protein
MVKLHIQYIVDTRGRRRAIQLPWHEFRRLAERLEDLDDVTYVKAHRQDQKIPMADVHRPTKRSRSHV